MHTEKHLRASGRLRCTLKILGGLRFVPLVVFNLVLPILIFMGYRKYGPSELFEMELLDLTQYFLPLFSIWWVVFVLREYLEADGNELFYIGGRKIIIKELGLVYLIAMLNIMLLIVLCIILLPSFFPESVRIVSACVFYFGLTYCMAFLLKSVSMTLLILLLYTLLNFALSFNELFFPLYMSRQLIEIDELLTICFPLFALGIFLVIVGLWLNKRFLSYN